MTAHSQRKRDVASARRGITHVEVATVAACIAISTAIIVPWTESARLQAVHLQCRANLQQVGLALQNYHDVYGMFPPIVATDDQLTIPVGPHALLLPYLPAADA